VGIDPGPGADVDDATAVNIHRITDNLRQHGKVAFDSRILAGFAVIDQGYQHRLGAKAGYARSFTARYDSGNGGAMAHGVLCGAGQNIVVPLIQILFINGSAGDTGVNNSNAYRSAFQPMGRKSKKKLLKTK
jgi:hypothetical protein